MIIKPREEYGRVDVAVIDAEEDELDGLEIEEFRVAVGSVGVEFFDKHSKILKARSMSLCFEETQTFAVIRGKLFDLSGKRDEEPSFSNSSRSFSASPWRERSRRYSRGLEGFWVERVAFMLDACKCRRHLDCTFPTPFHTRPNIFL